MEGCVEFRTRAEFLAHIDHIVKRAEAVRAEQATLVALWRAQGRDTEEAEAILVRLELALSQMELRRARLQLNE